MAKGGMAIRTVMATGDPGLREWRKGERYRGGGDSRLARILSTPCLLEEDDGILGRHCGAADRREIEREFLKNCLEQAAWRGESGNHMAQRRENVVWE